MTWVDQLVYMEGLLDEFYEDNGDNYIDESESLTDLASRGVRVTQVEAAP